MSVSESLTPVCQFSPDIFRIRRSVGTVNTVHMTPGCSVTHVFILTVGGVWRAANTPDIPELLKTRQGNSRIFNIFTASSAQVLCCFALCCVMLCWIVLCCVVLCCAAEEPEQLIVMTCCVPPGVRNFCPLKTGRRVTRTFSLAGLKTIIWGLNTTSECQRSVPGSGSGSYKTPLTHFSLVFLSVIFIISQLISEHFSGPRQFLCCSWAQFVWQQRSSQRSWFSQCSLGAVPVWTPTSAVWPDCQKAPRPPWLCRTADACSEPLLCHRSSSS